MSGSKRSQRSRTRHLDVKRRFARARPSGLWQIDICPFRLTDQIRNAHLLTFMDDDSRFVVGYGVHASAAGALVRVALEEAVADYGAPRVILADSGLQHDTWPGKSTFAMLCDRHGILQRVARPRRPQALGKVLLLRRALWEECFSWAPFLDLLDASRRLGLYFDYYNFHRVHSALGGLVPADRFFRSAPEVKKALEARVASNALQLARDGLPRLGATVDGDNSGSDPSDDEEEAA